MPLVPNPNPNPNPDPDPDPDPNVQVFVLAATNLPWELDVRRRSYRSRRGHAG